jgi:hypothetical protein
MADWKHCFVCGSEEIEAPLYVCGEHSELALAAYLRKRFEEWPKDLDWPAEHYFEDFFTWLETTSRVPAEPG